MFIYKITCKITKEFYIGQTKLDPEVRFRQHLKKAFAPNGKSSSWGKCPKFYNAIKKYGPENFYIETIDSAKNRKELNKRETHWITELDAINKGYNLCAGGDFGALSKEAKKKISKAKMGNKVNLGRKYSKETRMKNSLSKKGRKNPMYGKIPYNRKRILCLQNNKIYESIKQACIDLNIQSGKVNFSKHLSGKRKHVGGYIFKVI